MCVSPKHSFIYLAHPSFRNIDRATTMLDTNGLACEGVLQGALGVGGSPQRKPVSAVHSDPGYDGCVLRLLGATLEDSGRRALQR